MNANNTDIELKQTATETKRWALHDPVDGPALCREIAEHLDGAVNALLASAEENKVELTAYRVTWVEDPEDGHTSGKFRVQAQGVPK